MRLSFSPLGQLVSFCGAARRATVWQEKQASGTRLAKALRITGNERTREKSLHGTWIDENTSSVQRKTRNQCAASSRAALFRRQSSRLRVEESAVAGIRAGEAPGTRQSTTVEDRRTLSSERNTAATRRWRASAHQCVFLRCTESIIDRLAT